MITITTAIPQAMYMTMPMTAITELTGSPAA
jgi:hypothetical protein